ncbi:hypothetical protein GE061_019337 [Apolygus lucorum]|uniref:Uncharacterized protein n=1 Tax=Apolygus lucorum TaxID=248454 RepID=A0A6A4JZH5_APOLU|nr:hypothetical protein GE061_019337 [Apolygus lucorum]
MSAKSFMEFSLLFVTFAVFSFCNGSNVSDVVSTDDTDYNVGGRYRSLDASSEQDPLNKWFEVYNISMSWSEAMLFCKSRRGNMVAIQSQQENDLLNKVAVASLGPRSQYWFWIGGTKIQPISEYIWISNGHPFTYTNWSPGYPEKGSQYDCVVNYFNGTTWCWFTYDCSYKFASSACEYEYDQMNTL